MEKIRDSLKLRSTVKGSLLKRALFRGTVLGGVGGVVLVLSGGFLQISQLQWWGLPAFCVGVGLITIGLLPHRKLNKLRMNPYELWITHDEISLFRGGKPLFHIPTISIERATYVERGPAYGIAIILKDPPPEKVRVASSQIDMTKLEAKNLHTFGYPLFLPYFTQEASEELKACLET